MKRDIKPEVRERMHRVLAALAERPALLEQWLVEGERAVNQRRRS